MGIAIPALAEGLVKGTPLVKLLTKVFSVTSYVSFPDSNERSNTRLGCIVVCLWYLPSSGSLRPIGRVKSACLGERKNKLRFHIW